MIETIFLAIVISKLKGYKPSRLFKAWPIYLIISFELIYILLQILIFNDNYSFVKYSSVLEKCFLILFLILALLYQQYLSAIIGSACIIIGGLLNNLAISSNNGKMPVFPTLSYLTGYVTHKSWMVVGDIHILGTSTTKLKFLTDIFDLGYCVMSIGDIFIRTFVFLIVFNTIKELSKDIYLKKSKNS
ncbi:MAG: DUF5317 family protein [Clostridiaceae bacterium]